MKRITSVYISSLPRYRWNPKWPMVTLVLAGCVWVAYQIGIVWGRG